jgi:hypothetical protein
VKNSQAIFGAALIGGLLGLFPIEASASGVELRIGGMLPRANSILFDDDVTLYQVRKRDFAGAFGGIEVTKSLWSNVEIGLSVDGYGREIPTSYRDFTRPSGREIEQTIKFQMIPTTAIVRLLPSGRYRSLTPYVGVGAAAVYWKYEEFGDFIDFNKAGKPVVPDSFKSTGTTAALVVNAGLRYRINPDLQVTADFRNFWGGQRMGEDFGANRIDVSGAAVTIGVRLNF